MATIRGNTAQMEVGVQDIEMLLQNAIFSMGSRGVQLGIQADELFEALRQNMTRETDYIDQVSTRISQASDLVHIGTLLTSSLDLNRVLQEVMDSIIRLTWAKRAYLMLYDGDSLSVQVARNWDRETLPDDEVVFSRGIVQAAMLHGEVVLSANVQLDQRFKNMESVFSHQLRSVLCVPLIVRAKTIGVIYADNGDGISHFEVDLIPNLIAFANQAAIAIENARLFQQAQVQAEDLQRSRERIIIAREEERRRLRRDLHDGLGPVLGSFLLKIDASRKLVKHNPDIVDETLVTLKHQIRRAIEDVRVIVHGLRPPALDEFGLIGALYEHGQQLNGLQVKIDAPNPLPPLSAAVEVTLYRIAMEALTNVVKHAEATRCAIRLQLNDADHELRLEISDDGCGLPKNRQAGVGLASMRERASELGGTCIIDSSAEGGTHICVSLPV